MQIKCPAGLRTPPKHLFGTLDTPCTVIGNFTKEMQDYSGFDSTVIFAPSHDTASAVCACPIDDNSVYISSGTSKGSKSRRNRKDSNAGKTRTYCIRGGF